MNILDKQDYQNLLELSKELAPMDINFQEKSLQSILKYFNFSGAAFPLVDNKGYYHSLVYANFNQLSRVIYNNYCYEQDFFAPANCNKNLHETVLTIDNFMTFEEYESSTLYTDVLSQNNFYYEALVLLKGKTKKYIGAVAVYHKKNSIGFTKKEKIILKEIGNIIETHFQIHLHIYNNMSTITANTLLHRLPIGMILCDSNFKILQINNEATNILKLSLEDVSIKYIEQIIKNKILPLHIKYGLKHYSLQNKNNIQISIDHLITKAENSSNYITYYAIFFQYNSQEKDRAWSNLMESKGITKREHEIANFLRMGYCNGKIAKNLHISENTVRRHRESIYKKLNITRINQLNIIYEKI
ncbi:LuxR C-terminal-related transcriptional regulator [Clostridium rectalis]|uniref:LuxR C-terminal-related transcriptional regulator n=1 Tax=Clostridium rectalis TaxID=2040295 RepID=UPI000F62CF7E|nr:helix-turn-helix transcriptional regulator [Clostridium rectalis]